MKTEEKQASISIPKMLIGFLSVLVPASFLVGTSYYQGMMYGFGIDSSNFPVDINRTYIHAFYAFLLVAVSFVNFVKTIFFHFFIPPKLIITSAYLLLLSLMLYFVDKFIDFRNKKNISSLKLSKYKIFNFLHWRNNAFTRVLATLGLLSSSFLLFMVTLVLLVVFWWAIPYSAFSEGEKISDEIINKYHSYGCFVKDNERWNQCTTVYNSNNDVIVEGISIAEGNGKIAIINNEGSHVVDLPTGYKTIRKLGENAKGKTAK